MYELALSQSEQASQLPILNLFEFCLDIGEHFTEQIKLATLLSHSPRLRLTYELKEKFRDIFERHQSVEAGKAQLLDGSMSPFSGEKCLLYNSRYQCSVESMTMTPKEKADMKCQL